MVSGERIAAKTALTELSNEYKTGDARKALGELVAGIDNFESDPKNKKANG
jgi:hypothetical protein